MANLSNTKNVRTGVRSQLRLGKIRNLGLFSDGSFRVGIMAMEGNQENLVPVADHSELEGFEIGQWVTYEYDTDQNAINLKRAKKGNSPRDFAGRS